MRDLQRIQSCRMRALGIELEQEGTDRRIKVRQHRCKIISFGSHHLPRLQCIWTDRRMPPRRDLHRAYQRCEPERARSIRRQAELHAVRTPPRRPAHTMFFRCDGQHGCRAGRTECDLVMSSNTSASITAANVLRNLAIDQRTAVWMKPRMRIRQLQLRSCVFRPMPAPDSAACRPPIPRHAGRGFRGMSPPSVEVIPSRG